MKKILFIAFTSGVVSLFSQNYNTNKFHQIDELLPTPNTYRNAAGGPGHEYWQQQVDYEINVKLDETWPNPTLTGSEKITYINNSPDILTYLWVQLDQNIFLKNSLAATTGSDDKPANMSFEELGKMIDGKFDGGYKNLKVKDSKGKDLKCVVQGTMMRVDLPAPLRSKQSFVFSIDWFNYINNARIFGGRGGFEHFEADGNDVFELAQWFPRLCVYDDVEGWQNKEYVGRGEFALEFGNYKVNITVPADHIVASTGELKNASAVLTAEQQTKLTAARTSKAPVIIVSQDEAVKKEATKSKEMKTWTFEGRNVRDFAWASSRKFIWDALGVNSGGKTVMAMSYYPKEGNPLWEKYSTHAVAQTILTYSKYTIQYPYPVAISVNGPIGGMEYPMICFNGPRPEADGTYSEGTKTGLISVVIHEVGHNFFPMIINSDERQWTWMDEGFNTFVQYLTEKEWDKDYPSRRGEPRYIVSYMSSDKSTLCPIMTNSESILQFGNNAYGKPATALNILRETVMGRELFDFAFKSYCERWAFKHPRPADFFRTMEDASAVDLDWYWRGWFYGVEACDISISNVEWYKIDSKNPNTEKNFLKEKEKSIPESVSQTKNKTSIPVTRIMDFPELKDFYNSYDPYNVTDYDKKQFDQYFNSLSKDDQALLKSDKNFYWIEFDNVGGLIMPLIIEIEYTDGTKEVKRIAAEIWRYNNKKVAKLIMTDKEVKQFVLDPFQETADIDLENNAYPKKEVPSKFQLFKEKHMRHNQQEKNPMQLQKEGRL
ncbi:MAG: M1 family metallopeptidase [Bacteroidia bacterium]|nr:M1 family metallopeptidase [Bacteroidia bacterium]